MEKNNQKPGAALRHADVPENRDVAFEPSDVSVTQIAYIGAALIATILVAELIVWMALGSLSRREAHHQEVISPLRAGRPAELPPEPRLQGAPGHPMLGPQELKQILDEANAALNTSAWIDRRGEVARIPIDRAMDIIATRGLPRVPAAAASAGAPASQKAKPTATAQSKAETP